ncbi:hypothetical protein TIFTF001_014408 [Ficus carica]|uniref:Uncharacterized protein n=1 Tax=Ficus carica TaxID=3494 RepID=A0AA88A594_FICCA|nr:hypothetical protein TIFTF001_014408 [Ficus carica]
MEMVSSVVLSSDLAQHSAVAKEVPFKPNETVRVAKWSDRRMCPQWRLNSLESIVPENLPRPSARRRWESKYLASLSLGFVGRAV